MSIQSYDILNFLGVTGKVIDFVYRNIGGKAEVIAVIVQFEDEKIGQHLRRQHLNLSEKVKNENGVPIFKRRCEYKSQKKAGSKQRGKDQWVKQFPLVLGFGSTGVYTCIFC